MSSPSPTATPASGPMALGDTFTFDGTVPGQGEVGVSVAALSYTQPVTADSKPSEVGAGSPGDEWAQLEVKICSVKGNIQPSDRVWQLAMADGARATSAYAPQTLPGPAFPMDAKLGAGDCLRGKIAFAVAKGQRPQTAVYAPDSLPAPQKWAIPAQ
ncbi:hypothetical protein [Streptomyces sp. ISL-94]|uniref:hypothetical protein n=1 Tax=Streptomyces sp. ISL-94 TaxID=2819190 RepID=UPI001BE7C92B|nr:hypothetical protein [Streptomyces sp. ISL-94]MBT2479770.1 hypothetical protein [Streptomyces sp. ISL-94]